MQNETGIVVRSARKNYGDTTVVDVDHLHIKAGGVVALVGPNGAGKSTLLSMIGRLLDWDTGLITVDGVDVTGAESNLLATKMSILRQSQDLTVRLSVRELVEFGRFPHAGTKLTSVDDGHVERALEQLELVDLAGRRLDQLSGGQRQRAFIAMVLAQDTPYVLLDEPLNSLDMRHAHATMEAVRRMADDLAKTVVIVLHDINIAAAFSDRVIAMKDGQVVADGPAASVITRAMLDRVFDLSIPVHEVDGQIVAMHFAPSRQPDLPNENP